MTNPFKVGDRVTSCLPAYLQDFTTSNAAPYINHNHGGCTKTCRTVHVVTEVRGNEVVTDITKWSCAPEWFTLVSAVSTQENQDETEPLTRLELIELD